MGFEYKLELDNPEPEVIQDFISRLPGINHAFEYRIPDQDQPSAFPEAALSPAPYGLYFCAYGSEGKRYLGTVITKLASEFESVRVSEL